MHCKTESILAWNQCKFRHRASSYTGMDHRHKHRHTRNIREMVKHWLAKIGATVAVRCLNLKEGTKEKATEGHQAQWLVMQPFVQQRVSKKAVPALYSYPVWLSMASGQGWIKRFVCTCRILCIYSITDWTLAAQKCSYRLSFFKVSENRNNGVTHVIKLYLG